jgi:hypothetical protein
MNLLKKKYYLVTMGKSIADIHRPALEDLCLKNKWKLEECKMISGKLYFKIIGKDKKGFKIIIEHEIEIKDIAIHRIKKRIRQLLSKEPFDVKECVPETCGKFYSGKCIWKDKITNKISSEQCSQEQYKNKP